MGWFRKKSTKVQSVTFQNTPESFPEPKRIQVKAAVPSPPSYSPPQYFAGVERPLFVDTKTQVYNSPEQPQPRPAPGPATPTVMATRTEEAALSGALDFIGSITPSAADTSDRLLEALWASDHALMESLYQSDRRLLEKLEATDTEYCEKSGIRRLSDSLSNASSDSPPGRTIPAPGPAPRSPSTPGPAPRSHTISITTRSQPFPIPGSLASPPRPDPPAEQLSLRWALASSGVEGEHEEALAAARGAMLGDPHDPSSSSLEHINILQPNPMHLTSGPYPSQPNAEEEESPPGEDAPLMMTCNPLMGPAQRPHPPQHSPQRRIFAAPDQEPLLPGKKAMLPQSAGSSLAGLARHAITSITPPPRGVLPCFPEDSL